MFVLVIQGDIKYLIKYPLSKKNETNNQEQTYTIFSPKLCHFIIHVRQEIQKKKEGLRKTPPPRRTKTSTLHIFVYK